jgi:hypothetical protein
MAGGFLLFFLAKYFFGTMLPAMHTLNTQSFELSWKSRHGSTKGHWHDGLTTQTFLRGMSSQTKQSTQTKKFTFNTSVLFVPEDDQQ